MRPSRYEIRIDGVLPAAEQAEFVGMDVRSGGGRTVLTGLVADQSALLGLVARAESLGLRVTAFRRTASQVRHRRQA